MLSDASFKGRAEGVTSEETKNSIVPLSIGKIKENQCFNNTNRYVSLEIIFMSIFRPIQTAMFFGFFIKLDFFEIVFHSRMCQRKSLAFDGTNAFDPSKSPIQRS